jgi:hypothetical protein
MASSVRSGKALKISGHPALRYFKVTIVLSSDKVQLFLGPFADSLPVRGLREDNFRRLPAFLDIISKVAKLNSIRKRSVVWGARYGSEVSSQRPVTQNVFLSPIRTYLSIA